MKTIEDIENAAIAAGCWAVSGAPYPSSADHNAGVIRLVREAVAAEREAVANALESLWHIDGIETAKQFAKRVREWPTGITTNQEYRAEQEQKNKDARALLDGASTAPAFRGAKERVIAQLQALSHETTVFVEGENIRVIYPYEGKNENFELRILKVDIASSPTLNECGRPGEESAATPACELVAYMMKSKADVLELSYWHEGKHINAALRILKVEDHE